jgi:antitoxin (DNA-binding transcriptional repressor) of toxin-antitoxin stability system
MVMKAVNLQHAKTHLSRYVDDVEKGEVIVLCRHNKPIAEIRAIKQPSRQEGKRTFGMYEGFGVSPSFFDPLSDDLLEAFGEKEK